MAQNAPANAGDSRDAGYAGSIWWWGRFPGVGNGNPLQNSFLETSMVRAAWWSTVQGGAESEMTEHVHIYTELIN